MRTLVQDVLAGNRRAIGRAISIIENGDPAADDLLLQLGDRRAGLVLGVTGPPGVGKSTLIGRLLTAAREAGHSVGAILIDPSSPFGGGAILGDRYRMADVSGLPDVFIRSMASRGHVGGLAAAASRAARVLAAGGKEVVLLETVGVGQSEIEIAAVADLVLLVLQPGAGDDLQAEKAGILEIADLLVLNKADHPDAERALLTLKVAARAEPPERRPLVLPVIAERGEGIEELWASVWSVFEQRRAAGVLAERRAARVEAEIRELALERLRERLGALLRSDPELVDLLARVRAGTADVGGAVEQVLARLGQSELARPR
jgi:LAO/AO transport system kinase